MKRINNPYLKNADDYLNNITDLIDDSPRTEVKVGFSDKCNARYEPPFNKLTSEYCDFVAHSYSQEKYQKAFKEMEKWMNEKIFENGKYDKMDSKSVILLAKFMFNKGLKYV